MEMTIDEYIGVIEDLKSTMGVCMPEPEKTEICTSLSEAIDTMRKYQIFQAKYVERLKADMIAMLTEIQLEIEELDTPSNGDAYMTCSEIIQQKINALKAESEDKE